MSRIKVDRITNRAGTGDPLFPNGVSVVGLTSLSNVVAGIATFENVSIGGTLTYEDVTNIDSTGIVTAKSGIKVGSPLATGIGASLDSTGNAQFTGIITASAFYGNGANLDGIVSDKIFEGNTEVEVIDTGSDGHVKMTTEGSERVRVGPAGQIGLGGANYGSSGQVITSAGNASAPTWSAIPPGGNQLSMVADGAIAAGNPCIVTSAGKAQKVGLSYAPASQPGQGTSSEVSPSTGASRWPIACNAGEGLVFNMWFDDTNTLTKAAVTSIATPSSAPTSGTVLTSGLAAYSYILADCCYVGNNKVCVVYRSSLTNLSTCIATINPSTKAITLGTFVGVSGIAGLRDCAVSWDPDNERLLFSYIYDAGVSNKGYHRSASISGTDITMESSSTQFTTSSGLRNVNSVYDTNANRHIVCYLDDDNNKKAYVFSAVTSGTTVTVSADVELPSSYVRNGSEESFGMYFDASTNKTIVVVPMQSPDNIYLYNFSCNTSTGAITVHGTYTQGPATGSNSNRGIIAQYEPVNQRGVYLYLSTNQYVMGSFITSSSSSNTLTLSSNSTLRANTSNESHLTLANYDNLAGNMQYGFRLQNQGATSNKTYTVMNMNTSTESTNFSSDNLNFLGFAENAISDGATGTITLDGNVVGNQSGLTPGLAYRVNNDGSLTQAFTTWDVGLLAIAADKGIVRRKD